MRRSTVASVAPLAIFVAALIANRRAATSLLVWSDTFNDQADANRCLTENLYTLLGTQTSIRGLFHAVAWLDLRTLLQRRSSPATVGFAPPSWRQNLLTVLAGEPGSPATTAPAWPRMEVAWWTLLALATWVGSFVERAPAWAAHRRASIGALAIVIPTLPIW
jgi:hypothetical protein